MPFKHKSKAKQEIKGEKIWQNMNVLKPSQSTPNELKVEIYGKCVQTLRKSTANHIHSWIFTMTERSIRRCATRCDKSGTFWWKRFAYIYIPTIHRERRPRRKCKHISVIIKAGTHKAKYRVVMQSITWLWVEFYRELSYFTFAPTEHKLATARKIFLKTSKSLKCPFASRDKLRFSLMP